MFFVDFYLNVNLYYDFVLFSLKSQNNFKECFTDVEIRMIMFWKLMEIWKLKLSKLKGSKHFSQITYGVLMRILNFLEKCSFITL